LFLIIINSLDCQPSDEEYDLWIEINTKLSHTEDILAIVRNYPGAANQIRAAIERYTDEAAQEAAWQALIPLVHQLRICYDFGVYLAQTVPRLLHALCSDELTVWEHLETQQALFKQFAEILDFIMQFDNLKRLVFIMAVMYVAFARGALVIELRHRTVVELLVTPRSNRASFGKTLGGGCAENLTDFLMGLLYSFAYRILFYCHLSQLATILYHIIIRVHLMIVILGIQNEIASLERAPTLTLNVFINSTVAYNGEDALLRQEIEELSDECCSKMSLFYAEATPMLKLISRYATQCHMVDAMVPMDVTSECLAAMAHICRGLLVKPSLRSRVTRDDTLMLLLRVMTGVIILYDHIDPYGVFRKASKLDPREVFLPCILWFDSVMVTTSKSKVIGSISIDTSNDGNHQPKSFSMLPLGEELCSITQRAESEECAVFAQRDQVSSPCLIKLTPCSTS
ncbi:unnamed protein product, partial [Hymenolepis diminuta]|uniref:DUF1394 domain-containing protein n=1 Tax=Hymenolepis diminuta TaxID=6216 RepID=A0A158QBW9_HYMDI